MKNQLLLIIGIKGSGKSWLANVLDHNYAEIGDLSHIFEEPALIDASNILGIHNYIKNTGHAIVVCSLVTTEQVQALAPDRIYNIALKGNR